MIAFIRRTPSALDAQVMRPRSGGAAVGGPQSEAWRLDWALRTCVSVAAFAVLYLVSPTRDVLAHFTDPAFTAYVTVLVKDVTLGASIRNAWACILGSLIATVMVQIIVKALLAFYSSPGHFPSAILLACLFFAVFAMQCMELELMGKKLGVSLLALNLVSMHLYPAMPLTVWPLFMSVLVGSVLAMVGLVIPLPIRMAGEEVQARLAYLSQSMATLLHQEVSAWMHEPLKTEILDALWTTELYVPRLSDPPPPTESDYRSSPYRAPQPVLSNRPCSPTSGHPPRRRALSAASARWRKLVLVIQACSAFRRAREYKIGWLQAQHFDAKGRQLRLETALFLSEQIDVLRRRHAEAQFEPFSGLQATRVFARYLGLLQSTLSALVLLERQVARLEELAAVHFIFVRFLQQPAFRAAVYRMVEAIGRCLRCVCCVHLSATFAAAQPGEYVEKVQCFEVAATLDALQQARADLDGVYLRLRRFVYYNIPIGDEDPAVTPASASTIAGAYAAAPPPLLADVSFNLNTTIFVLDSLADLLTAFIEDATPLRKTAVVAAYGAESVSYLGLRAWGLVSSVVWPARSVDGPTTRQRVLSAGLVALAMTLAGLFGIVADRPAPALAAFTIAYLAGGASAATGANVMTCLNRALGTGVACVYVICVAYVLVRLQTYGARALLLGVASVLAQLPATYVRSFPLHSYSGTVAGFTVGLLLINPDLTVEQAVDRIVDTFIGVALYLALELLFLARPSEALLLDTLAAFLSAADQRFAAVLCALDVEAEQCPALGDNGALQVLAARTQDLLPFYHSEPRLLRPPVLPLRLLQEVVQRQEQVLSALHLLTLLAAHVRGCRIPGAAVQMYTPRELAEEDAEDDRDVRGEGDVEAQRFPVDVWEASASGRTRSVPADTLPRFQAMLVPLQSQLRRVGTLVSASMALLSHALTVLLVCDSARAHDYRALDPVRGLQLLDRLQHERLVRLLDVALPPDRGNCVRPSSQRREQDYVRYHAMYFGEVRGQELEALVRDFQALLTSLQQALVEADAPSPVLTHPYPSSSPPPPLRKLRADIRRSIRAHRQTASNAEMKVVGTLLYATQLFLEALQGMAKTVARMQACRDIAVTQNPTKQQHL